MMAGECAEYVREVECVMMGEVINEIREVSGVGGSEPLASYSGYEVVTSEQVIQILIDAHQECCENWGYIVSEDDLDYFVGSELIGLETTDTALQTTETKLSREGVNLDSEWFEGSVMFVTLKTSRGALQFALYNDHNGYYGHHVVIRSKQLSVEEVL